MSGKIDLGFVDFHSADRDRYFGEVPIAWLVLMEPPLLGFQNIRVGKQLIGRKCGMDQTILDHIANDDL
jgi:hypothetical protein